jgi:hypothetical protein
MAIVEISQENSPETPYLKGGQYGPGLENEADVELWRFEFPAVERACPFKKEQAWILENPTKHAHAYFGFSVVTRDGNKHYVDRWVRNDRKRLRKALLEVGATVADGANGSIQFDTDDVAPRKLGGLEMGEAREYEGEMRTGFINKVLGK